MTDDDNTAAAAADDATSEGEFASGFAGVETIADRSEARGQQKPFVDLTAKPPANGKVEPARDAKQEEVEPPPEVVQITKSEWNDIKAAAAKTASYDKQLAQAFGTMGNMQRMINSLQPKEGEPPPPARGVRKVEISREAFAEMERDFPELAQQTRAALEAALSSYTPRGEPEFDIETKIGGMLANYVSRRQIEELQDAYPDWRTIVGAVDASRQQPDPENPFRKWLAGKEPEYQDRINSSESAAVIGRAIRLFQRETAPAPAKPNGGTPRDAARADRIRAAVQPRGDNAGAAPGKSENDEFEEGFRGARG